MNARCSWLDYCACPKGMDLGDDDMTCQPNECEDDGSDDDDDDEATNTGLFRSDQTWSPSFGNNNLCVTKKFNNWKNGQKLSMIECNYDKVKDNQKWYFGDNYYVAGDGSEGRCIKSVANPDFCVTAGTKNKAQLFISQCDDNNENQKWKYDENNGQLVLASGVQEGWCVYYEANKPLKNAKTCKQAAFGN